MVLRKFPKNSYPVRESDLVARLDEDEFVFALPVINSENATKVAKHLIEVIEKPINIKGKSLKISGSIGAAVFPDVSENIDRLLKQTDMNMYNINRLKYNNGEDRHIGIREKSNDRN